MGGVELLDLVGRNTENVAGARPRMATSRLLALAFVADRTLVQRLNIDQAVVLSLDEIPEPIRCRVHDIQGPVSRLAYHGELPPDAVGRVVLGSAGYLVFEDVGVTVGLRVAVRAHPPYLDVAITDGITFPERRAEERVKLVTQARILAPDQHDREQSTHTIDLSEGGALLKTHPAFEQHERFDLELILGDDPQPITASARIVRRAQHAVGVMFESIPADDAMRFAGYLTRIRQQRRLASLD